jgi:glycosyltransferase involved in cell wall biosynthesis
MSVGCEAIDSRKLFSCIVPTLNEKDTINDFIASLYSQDYRPMELLIVDGGSTDGTQNFISQQISTLNDGSFSISLFHEKDFGEISSPANARNIGLNNTIGEYILFIDSDTVFIDNNTISKALSEIGKSDFICIPFKILIDTHLENEISKLLDAGLICIYRKEFIEDTRFIATLGFGEDREFNYRLFKSVTGPIDPLISSVTIGRHFPHTKAELRSQNQWYGRTILKYIKVIFHLDKKDFAYQFLYVLTNILLAALLIAFFMLLFIYPFLSFFSLILIFILVAVRSKFKVKSIYDLLFATWYYLYSAMYFLKGLISSFGLKQKIGRY